jgi:transposase
VLLDNGIMDRGVAYPLVEHPEGSVEALAALEVTEASRVCIRVSLEMIAGLQQQKRVLQRAMYETGEPLRVQVELLIGIRGVTPFLALVYLADVGEVRRFTSARKLSSYLGTVPRSRSSGGVTHSGHINRASRHLARTMFSQAIPHMVKSSAALENAYRSLARTKGYGRARIATLRRMFTIMRRMLLEGTPYRWLEPTLYAKKMRAYDRMLAKKEGPAEAA